MHFLARFCVGNFLVLVIAFTSVELAAARGQNAAVGTMVICTGTGPVHILVDENGEPTGGVMICPDYALAFLAHVTTAHPDLVRVDQWQALWRSQTATIIAERATPQSQPRGPPAPV